jgi:hypothetical protein
MQLFKKLKAGREYKQKRQSIRSISSVQGGSFIDFSPL